MAFATSPVFFRRDKYQADAFAPRRSCDKISVEVKREAPSRLPATELFYSSAAALENACGEFDTSSVINRGVVVGGPSFSSRRPRDDNFDSADQRDMKNPFGILQRPHGQ